MSGRPSSPRRRARALDVARALYLVSAVGFGWWGLRSHGDQIAEAIGGASVGRLLLACLVVMAGLALTGSIWRGIVGAYGHVLPARQARSIFFVGQLGKYIPGSVWSLGAQADMARRFRVPARTTVAAGLLFLWVHVVTAIPVATIHADGAWGWAGTPWARAAAVALAVGCLAPGVLARVGDLLAGAPEPLRLAWADSGRLALLMAAVWGLYGGATLLAVPPGSVSGAGGAGELLPVAVGAFAASYVVGVVVVLAPAGVGAREATLIALLSPVLGLPVAAATALLIRVVHTVCDFAIAGLTWALARNAPAALPLA